jgi:4-nitrophenyl phosphatase
MTDNYLKDIKGLIIDMDGVLWHDTEPIGDLSKIFDNIRKFGLRFILATNNATKTVDEYLAKLKTLGVDLEKWQVINSAEATGLYLQERFPQGVNAYVVGEPSLKMTLESCGVTVVDLDEPNPQVVVASLDYSLNYRKLEHASLLIQNGCFFIGTNPDVTLPTPKGFIPGSGTIVAALEIATKKKAKIIGKPEPYLYQMAMKRLALKPNETLAVGDRLETDILGAVAAGMRAALVLSGASSLAQAKIYSPQPEIISKDFTDLINMFR